MKIARIVRWFAGACVLAAAFAVSIQPIGGQAQPTRPTFEIQSLTEPGQGLNVDSIAPETGLVTFAASPREGLLLPGVANESAEARALRFVEQYGAPFGLTTTSQVKLIGASPADAVGVEHVRFQQVHNGVPVRAGEFIVHLRGARAVAANGHIIRDLPESVIPEIAANIAQSAAVELIAKHQADQAPNAAYSEPRLEILNRALLSDNSSFGSRLAWFIEATGPLLREFIWVDAQSGAVLLNFSQLTHAKSRRVYTANSSDTLPGALVRLEGQPPTGDDDADKAYDYSGLTYDYFFTNHARDSFDNAGAALISTVHYCRAPSCPNYPNAFWNGTQMVYGNGYASADDVVGHELTHAVTERSAGLLYYVQSGALNESFSDIFGEALDLTDGVGNDTAGVRWQMGEDLTIGAIRNMMSPNLFGDPAKMSDSSYFSCTDNPWTDPNGDRGGVHINSGIPNKAFALMVDGGTFNGQTITGIGLTKAAKIQYRALTTYLTSGGTFLDNYNAVNRSCTDLVGTVGITAADCTQVNNALLAVEMNDAWACSGATLPPAMCPVGSVPNVTFSETFEAGLGNWTAASTTTNTWELDRDFEKSGLQDAYGPDPNAQSDHHLAMNNGVTIPAGGRLYFDHAFEFENDFLANYDGGVLEYSAGGGAWMDAGGLIDAGQTYVGQIDPGNPVLGGRQGFVKTSFGYTGTRLDLSSLAGQSVRFRFRIGSDAFVASLGWVVDNVSIYACGAATVPGAPTGVSGVRGNAQVTVSFTAPASNGGSAITSYTATASPGGATASGASSPLTVTGLTNGVPYTFTVTATNAVGTGPASAPSAAVTPATTPGAPTGVSGTRGNGQVTVSFTAPSNGGDPITSYTVTASPGGANATGSSSPITVSGLTNGVPYTFTVRATNGVGTGPGSAPSSAVTPATVPGAPTGVTANGGNAQATVSFVAPADNGGNAITSYTVTASPGGATASGSGSPITVAGLTNGTAYTFTVTATNSVGTGAASTPSAAVTPTAAPGTPVNFTVTASGLSILATWTSTGGAPTAHTLQVATRAEFPDVIFSMPLGPASLFSLDAPPGTAGTFFFRVIATNAFGSSPPSAAAGVSLPAPITPPGSPVLQTAGVSGNNVTLNWAPGSGGAPSSYLLLVGSSSGASDIGAFPMGTFTSISSSAPDGTYFARVQASNAGGSAISNEISFTVGAPCVAPTPPTSPSISRSGNTVTVNWAPPAMGSGPFTYLIIAGTSAGSSNLGSFPMGGATMVTTGVPSGSYFLRIRAANACGVSGDSVEASVVVP